MCSHYAPSLCTLFIVNRQEFQPTFWGMASSLIEQRPVSENKQIELLCPTFQRSLIVFNSKMLRYCNHLFVYWWTSSSTRASCSLYSLQLQTQLNVDKALDSNSGIATPVFCQGRYTTLRVFYTLYILYSVNLLTVTIVTQTSFVHLCPVLYKVW